MVTRRSPSGKGSGRSRAEAALDDWALVGESSRVADEIERYRDGLGMTHLVVRGSIPLTEPPGPYSVPGSGRAADRLIGRRGGRALRFEC